MVSSSSHNDGDKSERRGLSWRNLSVQVGNNSTATSSTKCNSTTSTNATTNYDRTRKPYILLNPCSGNVPPGRLCGIIGPSGAGKSMFLSAVAGGLPRSMTSPNSFSSSSNNNKTTNRDSGRIGPSYSGTITLDNDGHRYTSDHKQPQHHDNQDPANNRVAWLSQYDHFFSMLTVRETLDLAAFLEAGCHNLDGDDDHDHSDGRQSSRRLQREELVDTTLKQLGLWNARNRIVGNADPTSTLGTGDILFSTPKFASPSSSSPSVHSHGRLSGGERRRLSLGLELVAQPQLFVGDEPTTGVDASMSDNIVQLIKRQIVRQDIPGLLSLHQPRSSIWQQLDYVMLMASGGHVLYFGPRDEALNYFSRLGYKCPTYTNPAEFLLDLISVKPLDLGGDATGSNSDLDTPPANSVDIIEDFLAVEDRVHQLADAFSNFQKQQPAQKYSSPEESRVTNNIHSDLLKTLAQKKMKNNAKKVSMKYFVERFYRLLLRSWRQNIRDHKLNGLRLVVSVGNAFLFGNVFKVPFPVQKEGFEYYNAATIPDRTGLLCMGVVNMVMLTVMKTIDLISKEKPVVLREQRRNQYSSLEYLLSKAWAEFPLDILFAMLFAAVIKTQNGLRIAFGDLAVVFALMTTCGASLGLTVGAWSSSQEVAMAVGVPLMIILLSVGMLTQGDVTDSNDESLLVLALQSISPIYHANKAICLQEYQGMLFEDPLTVSQFRFVLNTILGKRPKIKDLLATAPSGDDIVEELGIGETTFDETVQRLVGLSILFLVISWIGLVVQTSKSKK